MNVEIYSRHLDIDLEELSFDDLGNLAETGSIDVMHTSVEKVVSETMSQGYVASVLGGEHSVTYGCLNALPEKVGVIIFDAHFDLRSEFADLRMSHATFLRRYIEKNGCDNIVHVGGRAGSKDEWRFVEKNNLPAIFGRAFSDGGKANILLKDFLEDFDRVYVSIDLDVLDPAYAPGVGNPEAGGLTIHQLLELIYAFKGKSIVGFDIVELSPPYDNGTTSVAAAKCLTELLCLSSLGMI
uniref:Putative agmatinase (SpeB) n=1 Tax=uncultured marine thaumarchaeote KM3_73_F02 TaxID=1456268 RepID=A0A075HIV8_9ARCH|nr:putative agmatinase (speB) [uncultured marine thaumarchaeote KM3_73_F02]